MNRIALFITTIATILCCLVGCAASPSKKTGGAFYKNSGVIKFDSSASPAEHPMRSMKWGGPGSCVAYYVGNQMVYIEYTKEEPYVPVVPSDNDVRVTVWYLEGDNLVNETRSVKEWEHLPGPAPKSVSKCPELWKMLVVRGVK